VNPTRRLDRKSTGSRPEPEMSTGTLYRGNTASDRPTTGTPPEPETAQHRTTGSPDGTPRRLEATRVPTYPSRNAETTPTPTANHHNTPTTERRGDHRSRATADAPKSAVAV
jgi:hypothetical protein